MSLLNIYLAKLALRSSYASFQVESWQGVNFPQQNFPQQNDIYAKINSQLTYNTVFVFDDFHEGLNRSWATAEFDQPTIPPQSADRASVARDECKCVCDTINRYFLCFF